MGPSQRFPTSALRTEAARHAPTARPLLRRGRRDALPISFVTAFAVQVTGGWLAAWLLPTIVGSPLIAMRTRKEVATILQTRHAPALLAPVEHSGA